MPNQDMREQEKRFLQQTKVHKASTPASVRHRVSRHPGAATHAASAPLVTPAPRAALPPTVLSHGDFREVDWSDEILNGCDATGADFSAATLLNLCALGATLCQSQLEETQLQNAALCGADLTGANLRHADLRRANLSWCNLRGANLFATDLRGANLAWADLRAVDLRAANLRGAYYNNQTQWPTDFDPHTAAMICLSETR